MAGSEPAVERRRRRPAISCALCRRRKIRCNRETPCSNCVRSRTDDCVYENPPPPPLRPVAPRIRPIEPTSTRPVEPASASASSELPDYTFITTADNSPVSASDASTVRSRAPPSLPSSTTTASTPSTQVSFADLESLKRRIHELEGQLAQSNQVGNEAARNGAAPGSGCDMEFASSGIGGTVYLQPQHCQVIFGAQIQTGSRSVMHKTQLFGQSHWINGVTLFLGVFEAIEPYVRDASSRASSNMAKCKSIGRLIKARRAPLWPVSPTPDLPPKDLADKLIERYIFTSESIYRVLHIPSLKRALDELYVPGAVRDTALVVQVKLALAIGAVTHDASFSLRSSAIRWIYEAQTWLWKPEYKSRLTIPILQTSLLLLLARDVVGVGGDLVWISAGALMRTAIYMGLHIDPSRLPKRSTYAAEMRRRLWNTILEVVVQSSMTAGGPPLLSLDDFNTEPPGNFDDEQLLSESPNVKPKDQFTQTSVAIALRKALPIRLAIVRLLNSLNARGSYEETIKMDGELRAVYKDVRQGLKACCSNPGPSPSTFAIEVVDFIMRHYMSALHIPYFGSSLGDTRYAFSRKVIVDTCLKLWAAVYPARNARLGTGPTETDLSRLDACGSSFYRFVGMQSCLFIAAEIRTQSQEEAGLGPASIRPDLLSILDEMTDWTLACIRTGKTNIKGYIFATLVSTEVKALLEGVDKAEVPGMLLRATEEAEDVCLEILNKIADEQQGAEAVGSEMELTGTPADVGDGWGFMMSDVQFDFSDLNPNGWVFQDMNMNEYSLW